MAFDYKKEHKDFYLPKDRISMTDMELYKRLADLTRTYYIRRCYGAAADYHVAHRHADSHRSRRMRKKNRLLGLRQPQLAKFEKIENGISGIVYNFAAD